MGALRAVWYSYSLLVLVLTQAWAQDSEMVSKHAKGLEVEVVSREVEVPEH